MKRYRVCIWKTTKLEVVIEADGFSEAAETALDNFYDGGSYDDREDAETIKVEAICSESDVIEEEAS